MHATLHDHPSQEMLTAYGAGKLDDEQVAEVETHLAECELCVRVVSELPSNSIIDLLRDAKENVGGEADKDTALTEFAADRATKMPPGMQATMPPDGTTEAERGRDAGEAEIPLELTDHPRYEILERLGEGGMGRVFKARHKVMNRIVALKLISRKLVSNAQAIERFRREVHAAASLSHKNIVTAHDAEQAGDVHFLAMEFVDGQDLEQLVKNEGPLSVATACDYIRQTAEGLQQAHEAAMVHRDIKPHNLMVGGDGKVKILDFGLASLTAEILEEDLTDPADGDSSEQTPRLTVSGTMMGTPDYISPEQGQDATSADIRSDIYGLGCTLYYLLSGKPPFNEGSVMDKLKAHTEAEAPPLDELRDDVPPEVAAIVRKMMAKRPEERYQTPADAVEALVAASRHLGEIAPQGRQAGSLSPRKSGKRIQPAYTGRSPLWPLVATAIGALFLLVALGAVILVATDRGVLEIRSEVGDVQVAVMQDGEQVDVIDATTGSRIRWLASHDYQIKLVGDDNDIKLDKTGFTMTRLGRVIVTAQWRDEDAGVIRRFSPDEKTITQDGVVKDDGGWKITADKTRTMRLFEMPLPKMKPGVFFYHAMLKTENVKDRAYLEMWVRAPGQGESFSKGFDHAVSGTNGWADYQIPFLVRRGEQPDFVKLNIVIEGGGTVWIKDIALRGRKVESVTSDHQRIQGVWSAESITRGGQALPDKQNPMDRTEFDGEKLTVVSADGTVSEGTFRLDTEQNPSQLWLRVNGQNVELRCIYKLEGDLLTLCMNRNSRGKIPTEFFSKPGTAIELIVLRRASGSSMPSAHLAEVRRFEGHTETVRSVAVSPDGRYALSAGHDKVLRLWEIESGAELRRFEGHTEPVTCVTFSREGKQALSSSLDATVKLWDVENGKELKTLRGHASGIHGVAFSPDGIRALSTDRGGVAILWDLSTGDEVRRFQRADVPLQEVAISPDGRRALTGNWSPSSPRLWDVASGRELKRFEGHTQAVGSVVYSPDGRRALSGSNDGTARLWDLESGKELLRLDGHSGWRVLGVAISPDGRHALTASWDKTVRLWDLRQGTTLAILEGHDRPVYSVAFTPDGRHALTAGSDTTVRLWRLPVDAPALTTAPFDSATAKKHQKAWADYVRVPVEREVDLGGGEKLTMVLIPPGEFLMGSSDAEQARFLEEATAVNDQQFAIDAIPTEGPQHRVTITRPFALSQHEITRGQFRQFVADTGYKTEGERDGKGGYGYLGGKFGEDSRFIWSADPGFPQTDDHPVVLVSWNDATAFCQWLSTKHAGVKFELPTEAQWEYACRAGTTTFRHCGDSESVLSDYSWFSVNSGNKTHPVGQLQPNGFGVYDMHGNVWEWCRDYHAPKYDPRPTYSTDPQGASAGTLRVLRGGSWFNNAGRSRSANRDRHPPERRGGWVGFRVASVVDDQSRLPQRVAQSPATPFETLLVQHNKNVTGNALAVIVFEQNGHAAFRFGKWLLVFEGVACKGDAKSAGLLAMGGFNYPIPGGSDGKGGPVTFGDQVTYRYEWDSDDNTITIGEKYTFKLLGKGDRLEFGGRGYDATDEVQTVNIAIDGSSRLQVVEIEDQITPVRRMVGQSGWFSSLAFLPGSRQVVSITTGNNGSIRVWDCETGIDTKLNSVRPNSGLAISPGGDRVAVGYRDGCFRIYDVKTGEVVSTYPGPQNGFAVRLSFSADGQRVLSADANRIVRLWDVEGSRELRRFDTADLGRGHMGAYTTSYSTDGRFVATFDADGKTHVWNAESGDTVHVLDTQATVPVRSAFTPDGSRLVLLVSSNRESHIGNDLQVFDTQSGLQVWRTTCHEKGSVSMAMSPQGDFIVTAGVRDKILRVWETTSGRELTNSPSAEDVGFALAVSPDGRFIVSSGNDEDDHSIQLWRLSESLRPTQLANGPALNEDVVKSLVAEAAGVPNQQWATLAGDIKGPDERAVEGMPLTMLLMTLNPPEAAKTNPDVIKDFWYLTDGLPKPGEIDKAVQLSKDDGYVSFIQPQYITNVTVKVDGETARGHLGFVVPKLYSGRVEYVAHRGDGQWRVEEFHLPRYKISLRRSDRGTWVRLPQRVWPRGKPADEPLHSEAEKLSRALIGADNEKRLEIVDSLLNLGRQEAHTDAMLVVLQLALGDHDDEVSQAAFHAVAEIGEESDEAARLAVPVAAAYMTDARNALDRRVLATRALGEIGEWRPHLNAVKESVAPLARMIDEDADDLAHMALWSLGEIGQKNPSAVASAIDKIKQIAQQHPSDRIRRRAQEVLDDIASASEGG